MNNLENENNVLIDLIDESSIGSIDNPATTGNELRTAIINAANGGTVYLLDIILTEQILIDSLPDITVTLASPTGDTVTITSLVIYPFFGINFNGTTANLTFQNVIYDGKNTGLGFRLSNPGQIFTMNNAIIQNCVNPNNGGGIQVNAGSIILNQCEFINNTVTSGNGGGVFVRFGTAVVNECIFRENTVSFNGGALYVSGFSSGAVVPGSGEITLKDSFISANVAGDGGFGGGIFADGKIFTNNTLINQNIGSCGGGISGGDVLVQNNTIIQDNIARISQATLELFREFGIPCGGGGIYTDNNNLTINNSFISNNKSLNTMDGGGIFFSCLENGNAFITDSQIIDNSAPEGNGGGIFTDLLESVTVDADSIFGGNSAQNYVYWEITTGGDSDIHRTHIFTELFSTFIPNQSVPAIVWTFLNAYNNYDINYVKPIKTVTVNFIDACNHSHIIHSTVINSFLGAVVVIPRRCIIIDINNNEWNLQKYPVQCDQIIELTDSDVDYIVAFFYDLCSPRSKKTCCCCKQNPCRCHICCNRS